MLGVQTAVTSSQSYWRIMKSELFRIVVCRIFIVVCRIYLADRARFAGMIPPLDPWHVGRAGR